MTLSISNILSQTLLKIGKESYKNIGIYNIGYITIIKIDDLHLLVNHANYILRQKLEINA